MRDEFVLGHLLRKHPCAEQLNPGDQFAALDAALGQILRDDEDGDLELLDEVDEVMVHAGGLGLLPRADGEPRRALARGPRPPAQNLYGDGRAARRIVSAIARLLRAERPAPRA